MNDYSVSFEDKSECNATTHLLNFLIHVRNSKNSGS